MSSAFGQYLKLSIFGQSHGEALGVTLDGFPAGMTIDMEQLLAEMARRAPGQSLMTTARKEPDAPEFLSGVLNGRTTGQPICAIIRNHESALEGLWRWRGFGASGSCGLHRACALLRL